MHAKLLERYAKNPEYGAGFAGEQNKVDCSGLVGEAADAAGIPGAKKRTQAWRIYRGLDGYVNRAVGITDNEICDLVVVHVPGGLVRPYGANHIGVIVYWQGQYVIMHASGRKKGVVLCSWNNWWEHNLLPGGYIRLVHGE